MDGDVRRLSQREIDEMIANRKQQKIKEEIQKAEDGAHRVERCKKHLVEIHYLFRHSCGAPGSEATQRLLRQHIAELLLDESYNEAAAELWAEQLAQEKSKGEGMPGTVSR